MRKINLDYTHNNSVARIILNDDHGNIIDIVMMKELQVLLSTFSKNNDLKLITFEGAGKHFSFGACVEEHKKEFAAVMLRNFHQLFYTLRDLSIPTLAQISGQCLGGGMELVLMCNFIFADHTARLGQPEIVLGVFPPPASLILSERIGLTNAEDLLITGRIISAEDAKSIGLVTDLFNDKESLKTGVEKWIETNIIPKSASSLRYAVRASRVKLNYTLSNFLPELEALYVNNLMETHDANEGINSFIEKRKPNWKNN